MLVVVTAGTKPDSRPPGLRLEGMRVPLVDQITRHPRTVLAIAVLLTIVSLAGIRYVHFDYNLLNLQAAGTESVVWERRILASAGRSGFAALASASSLEELRKKRDAFAKLPSVSEVDSALLLIPSDQAQKRKIIRDFAELVGPVRIARAVPVDVPRMGWWKNWVPPAAAGHRGQRGPRGEATEARGTAAPWGGWWPSSGPPTRR